FRAALTRWRLPAATFVLAARDGRIGRIDAGTQPARRRSNGTVPMPGWIGADDWEGLETPVAPRLHDDGRGFVVAANGTAARTQRIEQVLSAATTMSMEDLEQLQHDTLAWNAGQLVPLLGPLHSERADVDRARTSLLAWNRRVEAASADATIYVLW